MMTSEEFSRCVHPRELPRFLLALLVAVPVALGILVLIFVSSGLALAVILLIAFIVWWLFELWYASLIGHWILVSEDNYPRLHGLLREVQGRVGFENHVDIIVYEQKAFNAFLSLLFARRAIFIGSELLENGVTDDELRWIIGRFVGWMRARRRMGLFRYVISFVEQLQVTKLLTYPYVRATIYTGDRVGLAVINGDISTGVSAMNKLMVGRELGYSVNPAGIVRQYRRVKGSLFAFLARLYSPFPYMTARYTDLIAWAEREYPAQSDQFAAMNPSFQTSGGAWRLMWSTPKHGDARSNTIGVLLLVSALGIAVFGTFLFGRYGPGGLIYLLSDLTTPSYSSYEEGDAPQVEEDLYGAVPPAAPAEAPAEAGSFSVWQLTDGNARYAAEQARVARSQAESVAYEAIEAARQAHAYGYSNPYSGPGLGESSGRRYAGYFSNGYWHGAGVQEFPSGDSSLRYEGQFQSGLRSGYGHYVWASGQEYYGGWSGGERSGYGVQLHTDGSRYEGEWSGDRRNGYGVYWDSSGYPSQEGYWSDSQFMGSAPPPAYTTP